MWTRFDILEVFKHEYHVHNQYTTVCLLRNLNFKINANSDFGIPGNNSYSYLCKEIKEKIASTVQFRKEITEQFYFKERVH